MATITYDNKVALQVQSEVANINKIRAEDMNEIKSVVNTNDANVGDLADLETEDVSSIVNALNETYRKGVIYYTIDSTVFTFIASYNGYLTIDFVGSGWGYSGGTVTPSVTNSSGSATLITSIAGTVSGHDTVPDATSGKWIYEVTKGTSYTFQLANGFTGGKSSSGWIAKLEPKFINENE